MQAAYTVENVANFKLGYDCSHENLCHACEHLCTITLTDGMEKKVALLGLDILTLTDKLDPSKVPVWVDHVKHFTPYRISDTPTANEILERTFSASPSPTIPKDEILNKIAEYMQEDPFFSDEEAFDSASKKEFMEFLEKVLCQEFLENPSFYLRAWRWGWKDEREGEMKKACGPKGMVYQRSIHSMLLKIFTERKALVPVPSYF